MYKFWIEELCQYLKLTLQLQENKFNELFEDFQKARLEVDEQILRRASVIGMTTTCAARYSEVLKKVSLKIAIIAEAAEVPEAHVISALNSKCEHVILIGDHKELEPKAAVQELAIQFYLSFSLFERMVGNGLKYQCLQVQHRMRPEIADLVRHIYPMLRDHYSVNEYKNMRSENELVFVSIIHSRNSITTILKVIITNKKPLSFLNFMVIY